MYRVPLTSAVRIRQGGPRGQTNQSWPALQSPLHPHKLKNDYAQQKIAQIRGRATCSVLGFSLKDIPHSMRLEGVTSEDHRACDSLDPADLILEYFAKGCEVDSGDQQLPNLGLQALGQPVSVNGWILDPYSKNHHLSRLKYRSLCQSIWKLTLRTWTRTEHEEAIYPKPEPHLSFFQISISLTACRQTAS